MAERKKPRKVKGRGRYSNKNATSRYLSSEFENINAGRVITGARNYQLLSRLRP